MAEVTKPSALKFARVSAGYRRVKARVPSPYSLVSQTQVWSGTLYTFTFTLPPIKSVSDADDIMTFLRDLADGDNHFVCDVSDYVPSDVSGASTMQLRLSDSQAGWDLDRAKFFGFTFTAEEYK